MGGAWRLLCSVHVGEEIHEPDRGQQKEINLADKLFLLLRRPCQGSIGRMRSLFNLGRQNLAGQDFLVMKVHRVRWWWRHVGCESIMNWSSNVLNLLGRGSKYTVSCNARTPKTSGL
jgi:hypothetical protein